jgi:two-component system, sensor histidine kinase
MDKRPSLLRELAHELRDALSPARSALDLMRLRGFAADVSGPMAQRIEQGLERALATVDAFILAEQCENGTAALAPVRLSLQRLLQLTQESLPTGLFERCLFQPPRPDPEVLADVGRSVAVLAAMLQQALAAAPEGAPIELQAECAGQRAQVHVRFTADAHALPVGEDWFASYRAAGGAGAMALRTARCLMTLQRGALQLTPQGSGGYALVASFPLAVAADAPEGRAEPAADAARRAAAVHRAGARAAAEGTRILMVEDNAEVRRAYREALTAMGYAVTEAGTAEEALGAAAAAMPAVVLIDIHLPGMNGYQLAQALQARAGAAVRLVMLSGVTLDDTTLKLSREAGFDQCFDKAAGPKALHALLLRLL